MLKNYFKIAWRSLRKDKFYSGINILGLTVSTAAFLLMINFVRFEYSYENFHEKADDIYRVTYDLYQGSEYIVTDCEVHPPAGPLLKKELPEVEDYVRVQMMEDIPELSYGDEVYRIDRFYGVDPSMFTMFNYEFILGDPATALDRPMQAVLTESLAKRIFGSGAEAKGKTLRKDEHLFTITGVMEDPPANTHLKFDMLISFSSLERLGWDPETWNGNNNYLYLQLLPNADLESFNKKMKALARERFKESDNLYVAEPIKDIHLHSHKSFEPEANGDIKTVQFLLIIAILILLVGSVNYVNLTTARSAERIKEVGMRKVLGSTRRSLINQFLVETLLINLAAMAIALLLIRLALPYYFQLIGRPIEVDFFNTSLFWISCLVLFLFNCLLSGFYPAFSLSGTKPIMVTHRRFTGGRQSKLLRKMLVIGQFAAALIVLSASLIVSRQLTFMHSQDLGLTISETLVVKAPAAGDDSLRLAQSRVFKQTLSELANVESVSLSGSLPGVSLHELSTTNGLTRYGREENRGYNYYMYGIDANFIPVMGMKLAAGRNFRKGAPNKKEVIINEEAARLLGFDSPETAIGEKLSENSTVVGVVKNYHQQSLKEAILPMVHWYTEEGSFYSVKLHTQDVQKALAEVEAKWEAQFPGYPFDYQFFNEMFDQQYQADLRFGRIVGVFSGLILFITCLGLLGLTAYSVNRRAKEIGVRKVLGASVASVVTLLSRDIMTLVLIAILLGTPLAWYAMNRWLQDFAYRIELQWWMFALAGLLVLLIAILTMSFQSVKAALMNPVRSLRSE